MTTLGTSSAVSATLVLPKGGDWRADVLLDGGPLPTGATTLTVGDLVLSASVLRSDFDAASRPHAIVVGGIGWHNLITAPLAFGSTAGVRLSTVLAAISGAAKQTIVQPTDRTIGDHYQLSASRPNEPVRWSDALNDLVRLGFVPTWRVDPDGITRFTARTPTAVPTSVRATLMRHDSTIGLFTYGIDGPKSFLPGNIVEGKTTEKLVVRENAGKLEADVYSNAAPSVRELLRRMFPPGLQPDTYTVATVHTDGSMDLSPPADARHLPEIKNCDPWTGGIRHDPLPGTEVMVLYRGANRTRPIAFAVHLDTSPFAGVARGGDQVTVLLPPAVFTGQINGLPATGMVTWATGQTLGSITTFSARTKAGP